MTEDERRFSIMEETKKIKNEYKSYQVKVWLTAIVVTAIIILSISYAGMLIVSLFGVKISMLQAIGITIITNFITVFISELVKKKK